MKKNLFLRTAPLAKMVRGSSVRLRVRVITRAKKTRIQPYAGGIKVRLPAPAIEGRANQELIKLLAEYYQVSKKAISIVSGLKQKDKLIDIDETA